VARNLKKALLAALDTVCEQPIDRLLEQRYERLMSYGVVSR
jgi:acetyl-CoA carboxylase alpha subunit